MNYYAQQALSYIEVAIKNINKAKSIEKDVVTDQATEDAVENLTLAKIQIEDEYGFLLHNRRKELKI